MHARTHARTHVHDHLTYPQVMLLHIRFAIDTFLLPKSTLLSDQRLASSRFLEQQPVRFNIAVLQEKMITRPDSTSTPLHADPACSRVALEEEKASRLNHLPNNSVPFPFPLSSPLPEPRYPSLTAARTPAPYRSLTYVRALGTLHMGPRDKVFRSHRTCSAAD
jgi:hypothetical protein